MKNNLFRLSVLAAVLSTSYAQAQVNQTGECGANASACSTSNQHVGNVDPSASATNSTSGAAQAGNSANNNGATFSPTNTASPQQQQSIGDTSFTNQGGNTSSAATGNLSNNDNRSSASTGASNASNGSNTNGANTNGANLGSNTNNVKGGAGGAGGAGGKATSSLSGSGNSKQGQGQAQSSRNANALVGGNTSGTVAGGNQRTSVTGGAVRTGSTNTSVGGTTLGGSNYSDNSKYISIPPVVPPTPPAMVGVGNVVTITTACGAPQQVNTKPVSNLLVGIFRNKIFEIGETDRLIPVLDPAGQPIHYRSEWEQNQDGSYDLVKYGTQATIFATVVGSAAVQNIAIGGGGGSGSWGQAGGGTSGAITQMVDHIEIHECELQRLRPIPVTLPVIKKRIGG